MKKSLLKKSIVLAIATHAYDFLGGGLGAEELGVSEDEFNLMVSHCQTIAVRLAKGDPLNIGDIKGCIEYYKNLQTH